MFLISNRVGQPDYLTWKQTKSLKLRGFEFGAHGTAHSILTRISKDGAEKEIIESKAIIEKKLNLDITSYCYRGAL